MGLFRNVREILGGLSGLEPALASQRWEGGGDIAARCQVGVESESNSFLGGLVNNYDFCRVAEHQVGRLAGHTQEVCGLGESPPI